MSTHFTDDELRRYYESAKQKGATRVLVVQFVAAMVFLVAQAFFFSESKASDVAGSLIMFLMIVGAMTTL